MKIVASLVVMLVLVSCAGKKDFPDDVISVKPMQKIVWDLLQADEIAFQRKTADSTVNLKETSFRLYDTVFAIHKVSREAFYKSYEYYQRHPQLYTSMMTGVKNIGEAERKVSQSPAH